MYFIQDILIRIIKPKNALRHFFHIRWESKFSSFSFLSIFLLTLSVLLTYCLFWCPLCLFSFFLYKFLSFSLFSFFCLLLSFFVCWFVCLFVCLFVSFFLSLFLSCFTALSFLSLTVDSIKQRNSELCTLHMVQLTQRKLNEFRVKIATDSATF